MYKFISEEEHAKIYPNRPTERHTNYQRAITYQERLLILAARPNETLDEEELAEKINTQELWEGTLTYSFNKFISLMKKTLVWASYNMIFIFAISCLVAVMFFASVNRDQYKNMRQSDIIEVMDQSWKNFTLEVKPLMIRKDDTYCQDIAFLTRRMKKLDDHIEETNDRSVETSKKRNILDLQIEYCKLGQEYDDRYMRIYGEEETFGHAWCISKYNHLFFHPSTIILEGSLERFLAAGFDMYNEHSVVDCTEMSKKVHKMYINQVSYIKKAHDMVIFLDQCEEAHIFDSSIYCE